MSRILFLITLLFLFACKTPVKVVAPAVTTESEPIKKIYRGSYTLFHELEHTKLEVDFDWQNKTMHGKANISLHAKYHASDSVVLNARKMIIHKVQLAENNNDLKYVYNDSILTIRLPQVYEKLKSFTLMIDYTAQPEKSGGNGSAAINDDKGLYFINADGADSLKPRQIWTQGETESNSVWMPTIEGSNQKMTQEIYITVDSSMTTLSNGLLIWSRNNGNGSRTDYWKQSLPHAPYLTMMAIGNFFITKDKWRNLEVSYYTEPEFAPYARNTFGRTSEMMEFFSNKLGVDFPWEKYSQVVVRDFVSGAMENTSATLHREALQQTSREYLDGNYEDYISHELFHQWFGDLVTCESWANVVLNEGFANYSEYLWREYKFGRSDADAHLRNEMNGYIQSSQYKDDDVVRYYYDDKEDMYDAISYNKGGCILHMLRKYVGDDNFYKSLHEYLMRNKFGTAEIHDLRLAFEKITGEDMNWFFNQWFLNKGLPKLNIAYAWSTDKKEMTLTVQQKQSLKSAPLYRLPVDVDFYINNETIRKRIVIDSVQQSFTFSLREKPLLVNFDANKMLLCSKTNQLPDSMMLWQYYHGPLFGDRYEVLKKFSGKAGKKLQYAKLLMDAIHDENAELRIMALKELKDIKDSLLNPIKNEVIQLALHDSLADVRAEALRALKVAFNTNETATFLAALNDSSYQVMSTAFEYLYAIKHEKSDSVALAFENDKNKKLNTSAAKYFAKQNVKGKEGWFMQKLNLITGYDRVDFIDAYSSYFRKADAKMLLASMEKINQLVKPTSSKYLVYIVKKTFDEMLTEINDRITKVSAVSPQSIELNDLENAKTKIKSMKDALK